MTVKNLKHNSSTKAISSLILWSSSSRWVRFRNILQCRQCRGAKPSKRKPNIIYQILSAILIFTRVGPFWLFLAHTHIDRRMSSLLQSRGMYLVKISLEWKGYRNSCITWNSYWWQVLICVCRRGPSLDAPSLTCLAAKTGEIQVQWSSHVQKETHTHIYHIYYRIWHVHVLIYIHNYIYNT